MIQLPAVFIPGFGSSGHGSASRSEPWTNHQQLPNNSQQRRAGIPNDFQQKTTGIPNRKGQGFSIIPNRKGQGFPMIPSRKGQGFPAGSHLLGWDTAHRTQPGHHQPLSQPLHKFLSSAAAAKNKNPKIPNKAVLCPTCCQNPVIGILCLPLPLRPPVPAE